MRRAFVSYARDDVARVSLVARHLERLELDVWLDQELRGAQEWWAEILAQIRQCDVFVAIVSPASLESRACARERDYAVALGKPLLPVAIAELTHAVPSVLLRRQIVDYSQPTDEAAFGLVAALNGLPPAPPLPDPLPAAPEVPLSYLAALLDSAESSAPLDRGQQMQLLSELEPGLVAEDPDERAGAWHVLELLARRDDLDADTDLAIDRLRHGGGAAESAETSVAAGAVAGGPAPAETAPSKEQETGSLVGEVAQEVTKKTRLLARKGVKAAVGVATTVVVTSAGAYVAGVFDRDPPDDTTGPTATGTTSATPEPSPVQLPASSPLPEDVLLWQDGSGRERVLLAGVAAGGEPTTISPSPAPGYSGALDRTRSTFAYSSDGVLRVMAVDGTQDRELMRAADVDAACKSLQRPSWHPDSTALAVTCSLTEGGAGLFVVPLDGSQVTKLYSGVGFGDVTFSPDGARVLLWVGQRTDGGGLVTLRSDGTGGVRSLTPGVDEADSDPAWSPDGDSIAFRRKLADGSDGIFLIRADGSDLQRLTEARFGDYDPTFSPDGEQIAFKSGRDGPSGDPARDSAIFVMDADGGSVRRISPGPSGTVPAWTRR